MRTGEPGLTDWLRLLPDPALISRVDGEIIAANAPLTRLVGRPLEGASLAELITVPGDDLTRELRLWARSRQTLTAAVQIDTDSGLRDLGAYVGRLSGPVPDGELPLVLMIIRSRDARHEPFQLLTEKVQALTREISIRRKAEHDLLALKDTLEERVETRTLQLRSLAARLIEAEELERRRLAHSLHDNLQQLLVTAALQIDMLDTLAGDPSIREIASKLRTLVQESIAASRSLTLDLSPPILHDGGLNAAIAWLGRRNHAMNNLEVLISTSPEAEPDDEQTKIALFTAAKELLFNVVKHAGVGTAELALEPVGEERIQLSIRDEGRGFDVGESEMSTGRDGFGLFSLRERIDFLGGEMTIESSVGKGTSVKIVVPRGLRSAERGGDTRDERLQA